MNPLNSVRGSIITGVVAALVALILIHVFMNHGVGNLSGTFRPNELGLARWLHIISGVTWIGLLYYFNVVQTPGLAAAAADKGGPGGAGVSKYIAPRALLWFRWGAVATWFTGAWYLGRGANFLNAFTFGHFGEDYYGMVIGIGAWLGTIMLFNVWVFIWPNQKKILGLVTATDEEKARARKVAAMASRTNFVLSIPMLLCMASATHGLPL
ncbi:MAG TPA: urate hydroxylase PuuD [Steroidobacteraceae bacterium]|nr:urate hydroxylase PuuD [Steroidobacteraceae bacterium]